MKTVDCYRPGCYCTLDHQIEFTGERQLLCSRCGHHRLLIGRLGGDL